MDELWERAERIQEELQEQNPEWFSKTSVERIFKVMCSLRDRVVAWLAEELDENLSEEEEAEVVADVVTEVVRRSLLNKAAIIGEVMTEEETRRILEEEFDRISRTDTEKRVNVKALNNAVVDRLYREYPYVFGRLRPDRKGSE